MYLVYIWFTIIPDSIRIGKHMLNSMTVLTPSLSHGIGMALYAENGVCMNHSNNPNCHTLFDPEAKGGPTLIVRSLAPIKPG